MTQVKEEPEEDIIPFQSVMKRLKISTLKISEEAKSQKLSEAMLNIIFAEMDEFNVNEAYVTLFKEKQNKLYSILKS